MAHSFIRSNAPWLAAGAALTLLSSFGQTFFISLFAGEIREAYGLSHAAWGGIYTVGTFASAIVMIWAGVLTDHFRSRALGTLVLLGLAVACLAMAMNTWVLLLPIIIFSLRLMGQGMLAHIAVVSMSRWFIATRGRALAIAGLGFAFAEAVFPIIFVSAMLVVDWRWLWVLAATVAISGIPLLRRLLKLERTPQSLAQSQESWGMNALHWTRAACLRHWLFWFMVPALLGPSAFNTAFFFQQVHYVDVKGWTHLELVALFPIYTGVGVAAMIASGWLLDRLGTPRVLPLYQLPMVIAFVTFSYADSISMMVIGMVFLGLTSGANATLPNAFWAEFYGTRHLGAIKAMAAAVMVFGSAIGPGLTGALIGLGVGIETQYLGVAAFFLVSTVMMFVGVRRAAKLLVKVPTH